MIFQGIPHTRNHLRKKGVDVSKIHIEPMSYKEELVGFIIELIENIPGTHFKDLDFVTSYNKHQFWPPGWSKKRLRNKNQVANEALIRCFRFSVEPTWICVPIQKESPLNEQDVKEYLRVSIQN